MHRNQIEELFPIGPPIPDHRRFDPVTAVLGGGAIVGSLVGGGIQSSAAKKAAQIQADAARAAGDRVLNTTYAVNPSIGEAATTAGNQVVDTAGAAANKVTDSATQAQQGMNSATGQANDYLDPYISAGRDSLGQLQQLLSKGYQYQEDPGYQFRQQQGELALQRSAAAHGAALGGGALKDALTFNSGLASQEYQAGYNRFLSGADRLQTLASMGLNAGNTAGQNVIGGARYNGDIGLTGATTAAGLNTGASQFKAGLDTNAANLMASNQINAAKSYGDYLTGGANAQAAGTIGSANAWSNGITGGLNGAANLLMLQKLLKNPSAPRGAGNGYTDGSTPYGGG